MWTGGAERGHAECTANSKLRDGACHFLLKQQNSLTLCAKQNVIVLKDQQMHMQFIISSHMKTQISPTCFSPVDHPQGGTSCT
jgi:hypothetical protein